MQNLKTIWAHIKVSGNSYMKVLAIALFSSSLA